jgi:glycine/D-amino acid oxidase-like deaminating enzyme
MPVSAPQQPVIVGGGIIGLSTAYYLLNHPCLPTGSTVTLVERHEIAHAASGRAMGMVGREWQSNKVLPLSRLSWECYEHLAAEYDGREKWDWIKAEALGLEVESGASLSSYRSLAKGKQRDMEGANDNIFNGSKYIMDAGDAVGCM